MPTASTRAPQRRGDCGYAITLITTRRFFARPSLVLFGATGFSAHLYSNYGPPDGEFFRTCVHSGLCASLGDIGDLTGALDRSLGAYGSHKKYEIYDTEYGYQTAPPRKSQYGVVSQATAASWLNWAEYISWKNPRLASFDQYQLTDPTQPAIDLRNISAGIGFRIASNWVVIQNTKYLCHCFLHVSFRKQRSQND